MAKGGARTGAGRPPGVPNKDTAKIREAFQKLLDLNTENMIEWLQRVAAKDPDKALTICSTLAEYIIPKLARTDIHAEHKGTLTIEIVKFGEDTPSGQ